MANKNSKLLEDFRQYCDEHPEERFWQALRNWSKNPYILASNEPPFNFPGGWNEADMELPVDTFYSDKRNGK